MSQIQKFRTAIINTNTTGANTIVAAVTGAPILVWKMWFTSDAASLVTPESNSTALSGAVDLQANGALFFAYDGSPYFTTALGEAFVLSQSGTAQLSGVVYYTTD